MIHWGNSLSRTSRTFREMPDSSSTSLNYKMKSITSLKSIMRRVINFMNMNWQNRAQEAQDLCVWNQTAEMHPVPKAQDEWLWSSRRGQILRGVAVACCVTVALWSTTQLSKRRLTNNEGLKPRNETSRPWTRLPGFQSIVQSPHNAKTLKPNNTSNAI